MEEQKEIKIIPPEGYVIDKENSTFDCIKFKRSKVIPWRDRNDNTITGYYTDSSSNIRQIRNNAFYSTVHYNVFATEKQVKSSIAMARISQIMANDERFGGPVTDAEWSNNTLIKYVIYRDGCTINTSIINSTYNFLAFHTKEQRDLFLKDNEELVYDYLML